MKSRWVLVLAALVALCVAAPSRAGNVRITVDATVTSADTGMGFTVGQPVSFFWVVNDYAPETPFGEVWTDSSLYWEQETQGAEPSLWANVGGSGIGGTFQGPPGDAPYETLSVDSDGYFNPIMSTDTFNTSTNNYGIFLNADPSFLVSALYSLVSLSSSPFPSATFVAPLPNPASYMANYFGTYAVASTPVFFLEASNGTSSRTAYFAASSVTIASESGPTPVPEIDPAGMGSVLALLGGGLGLLERRRRKQG